MHQTHAYWQHDRKVLFERNPDTTVFFIQASWEQNATLDKVMEHHYLLDPSKETNNFNFSVSFSPKKEAKNYTFDETRENNSQRWPEFWKSGGAVDFCGSTDPRAYELERRVVLSQYLTKIQASGSFPPLIPAQEIFDLHETYNPAFELAYWRYGLGVAQTWKRRLGYEPDIHWQDVLDKLAPVPVLDGLILPHANSIDAYTDHSFRNDHPIALGVLGFLPYNTSLDFDAIRNTFNEVMGFWNWNRTWGWDYPIMAMTAARLGKRAEVINILLMDVQKNTYLLNGHWHVRHENLVRMP